MRWAAVAFVTLGCASERVLGEDAPPVPSASVSLEKLPAPPSPAMRPHGPDMAYLRAGCAPPIGSPESEPIETPPDPSDEFIGFYKAPTPLAPISALRTAPRGTLAYVRDRAIWIAAADGTARRKLVQAPWQKDTLGPEHGAPVWAFDGEELLFVTTHGEKRGRIIRFDRRCGYASAVGPTICDDSVEGCYASYAELIMSPEGTRVLYDARSRDRTPLVLLDLVRGSARVLAADHAPPAAWSPDGARVAYRTTDGRGLIVHDVATGAHDVVSHPSFTMHSAPVYGQDRNSLWFTAAHPFDEFSDQTDLFHAAAPNELRVHVAPPAYANEGTIIIAGGFAHVSTAVTRSPDGRRIALYQGHRMGGFGAPWVSRLSVHPTTPTGKTFDLGAGRTFPHHGAYAPEFAPDGKLVAYTMGYCGGPDCARATRMIAVSDGVTDAFVANGAHPAWTAAEGL